jgi:hypothetical protein
VRQFIPLRGVKMPKRGTPMSVDFDAMLPHIGEMGRYQITLYLMMCIPATLPAAFLAFNQVFLSAEPGAVASGGDGGEIFGLECKL